MKNRALASTVLIAFGLLGNCCPTVEAQAIPQEAPEPPSVLELQILPPNSDTAPRVAPLAEFPTANARLPRLMSPAEVELEAPSEITPFDLEPAEPQEGGAELDLFFEDETGPGESRQDSPILVPVPAPVPESSTFLKPTLQTPQLGAIGNVIPGYGFAIAEVVPGSAASRMKLETGDIILNINGQPVDSIETIQRELIRSQNQFLGEGLIRIDNVRARGYSRCQQQPPTSKRFIWLRFQM